MVEADDAGKDFQSTYRRRDEQEDEAVECRRLKINRRIHLHPLTNLSNSQTQAGLANSLRCLE